MNASTPELRPIPGWPDYRAGADGAVWSCKRGLLRRLHAWPNHKGYESVWLYRKGKRKCFRVHKLVALAWHGRPAPGRLVRHLDGQKGRNAPVNLAWGTRRENWDDWKRHQWEAEQYEIIQAQEQLEADKWARDVDDAPELDDYAGAPF